MCGRFTLTAEIEALKQRFQALFTPREYVKRYNIALSQMVLTVINDGQQNRMGYMRWGLIPFWAKDPSIGHRMINARSETIHEKPAFRNAFQKRRCLILADSFYEWEKDSGSKKKIPNRILLKTEEPFAMAGLYEKWISPVNEEIFSCTILTAEANEMIRPFHDRMPVILNQDGEKHWLDRGESQSFLHSLFVPYPAKEMEYYRVSQVVNNAKNESMNCIEPII